MAQMLPSISKSGLPQTCVLRHVMLLPADRRCLQASVCVPVKDLVSCALC